MVLLDAAVLSKRMAPPSGREIIRMFNESLINSLDEERQEAIKNYGSDHDESVVINFDFDYSLYVLYQNEKNRSEFWTSTFRKS